MKGEYKILLLAAISAAATWVADAMVGYFFFYDSTFMDLLILRVPVREIYIRCLFVFIFLSFGAIATRYYRNLRKATVRLRSLYEQLKANEQQLRASHQQLEGSEQQLRASNQQLEANNQQLKAAEQQLRAANQQLKASESALRSERNLSQQYLDVAAVMIIAIDNKRRITMINNKGCEILQTTEDNIVGKDWIANFIPAAARDQTGTLFERIIQGDIQHTEYHENNIVTAKGEERVIAWHNAVIKDLNNKVASIISSGSDVTDQKQAEKREQTLQDRLSRAERMESLGLLAGGVAHDLNNILTPIVALPDIILEDLERIPDADDLSATKDDVKAIKTAGTTAAEVIRDLLTLSRRGHYETHAMNINGVIAQYMQSSGFRQLKDENPNIIITPHLAADLLPVMGSEVHLIQIIMNLVLNAVEAMTHGGELQISTVNRHVEQQALRYESIAEGDYTCLSVRDTGAGISEEDLPKIFEPFYTKKKMGRSSGSGLGLSVVYGVTKDHNGYIDVHTQIGKFTEFVIYFPITSNSVEENNAAVDLPSGTESILVIDDIRGQRDTAERLLTRLGYKITKAANGREAIRIIQANTNTKFDLILLDMIMEHDFDGLDTYREIIKVHPKQKCIIISGFSETHRAKQAIQLGVGKFIAKPYTLEKIALAVRNELDSRQNSLVT